MKNSVMKKTLVISGINLYQGGTLAIYNDCLECLKNKKIDKEYNIIAFVHSKDLFSDYKSFVTFIELPRSRNNYLYRLFYEYIFFYFYSKRNKIEIWLSIHDITPNVVSKRLYTYCHNPSPFYKSTKTDWKFDKIFYLFTKFYKLLYRINIEKNDAIIVQQDWIRKAFKEMFGLKNIIVARPEKSVANKEISDVKASGEKYVFIFPCVPRPFKNIEIICQACERLNSDLNYKVLLTIDGNENNYSKYLFQKYSKLKMISWIGFQPRDTIFKLYEKTDCLIFPSKLETWGLPISEYKSTGKPIIVNDLPYAHETIGEYDKVAFVNMDSPSELADYMEKAINQKMCWESQKKIPVQEPYAEDWNSLWDLILY